MPRWTLNLFKWFCCCYIPGLCISTVGGIYPNLCRDKCPPAWLSSQSCPMAPSSFIDQPVKEKRIHSRQGVPSRTQHLIPKCIWFVILFTHLLYFLIIFYYDDTLFMKVFTAGVSALEFIVRYIGEEQTSSKSSLMGSFKLIVWCHLPPSGLQP